MNYVNWKLVFANDPNNNTLDKSAEKIIDITGPDNDKNAYLFNMKEEKDMVFISVEPIAKDIQVFHHLTQIGGSVVNPATMMVAIKGFANKDLAI